MHWRIKRRIRRYKRYWLKALTGMLYHRPWPWRVYNPSPLSLACRSALMAQYKEKGSSFDRRQQ